MLRFAFSFQPLQVVYVPKERDVTEYFIRYSRVHGVDLDCPQALNRAALLFSEAFDGLF